MGPRARLRAVGYGEVSPELSAKAEASQSGSPRGEAPRIYFVPGGFGGIAGCGAAPGSAAGVVSSTRS